MTKYNLTLFYRTLIRNQWRTLSTMTVQLKVRKNASHPCRFWKFQIFEDFGVCGNQAWLQMWVASCPEKCSLTWKITKIDCLYLEKVNIKKYTTDCDPFKWFLLNWKTSRLKCLYLEGINPTWHVPQYVDFPNSIIPNASPQADDPGYTLRAWHHPGKSGERHSGNQRCRN